jgi:hypothetical protein
MAWSKIPLQHTHTHTSSGPVHSLLKCFPLYPTQTPRPIHTTRLPNTWSSGWTRRALEIWGLGQEPSRASRRWAQLPPLLCWAFTTLKIIPGKLGRRSGWKGQRQFGLVQKGLTHLPPVSNCGYVRRCQSVLILTPNFQLNQKLDIQGRGQECGQPGAGTLLPQFLSWPTNRIQVT